MNKRLIMFLVIFAACSSFRCLLFASEPEQQPEIRTLTIQEAVDMTLARSPEVLLAKAQAIRAREAVRESRSLNLPQVVTGTGLAYNNGFPLSIEGSAPSIFQIGASQSILSKKNANLIREAKESAKASELGIDSARNELASKTARVYYELYRARKTITLATEKLEGVRKQQDLIEISLEAGKVRPVDAKIARTAVSSAQQELLVAQEQVKVAESELRELTGLSNAISIQTVEPHIDSPLLELQEDALFQQATANAPAILQAIANIKAKEFHVEAEKGENRPRIEAVSQYALFSKSNNYHEYFNRFTRNNYLVGLSIQIPLFNGFRTSARVAQSRQELTEEQYKLQSMKSELKLNIQKGFSALRIAKGAANLALGDLQSAKEIVEINNVLFQSGRISAKEMEDFRAQLRQKELTLLEADQVLFQQKLEILRMMGSLGAGIQ
jgi:outer membrane protein